MTKLIEKDGMAFIGCWNGATISISVPARTGNDWGSKSRFLDLPVMEPDCLDLYIGALVELREICNA